MVMVAFCPQCLRDLEPARSMVLNAMLNCRDLEDTGLPTAHCRFCCPWRREKEPKYRGALRRELVVS